MSTTPELAFDIQFSGFDIAKLRRILLTEKDLREAAENGLALMKFRIQKGIGTDGQPFSDYSTKRIYIPTKGIGTGNPYAKPKGGTKSRTKKTMRFDGGYAEFRKKSGRGTKKNLTLSGNLTGKAFRILKVQGSGVKKRVIIGWSAGSGRGQIAAGLDERENGRIFAWSKAESATIHRIIMARLNTNIGRTTIKVQLVPFGV